MNNFIIVWFDNIEKDFCNDQYQGLSKSEAIKEFYKNHSENAVLINIIEL